MASEAGHGHGEGLLYGYRSEAFWDGTIELLFYSDLKTSDLNDLRGHLRSFEAV